MKLSDKRQSELYDAIREPIVDLRLAVRKGEHGLSPNDKIRVEEIVASLESDIWRGVHRALNLDGQH